MNGKRVHIWNCKDCLKNWQKLHTHKKVMKHRIWLHASVTHSTRWAWPPVDWGDTNTSIQWSTTLCHQVVFACAFGAVSTTQGEAYCSNKKTGATLTCFQHIPLPLGPWIFKTIFQLDCLKSTWAWWPASHVQYIYIYMICWTLYLIWFVTILWERICSLGMLESPSPAHGKLKNTYSIVETCKWTLWILKAPSTCIIL